MAVYILFILGFIVLIAGAHFLIKGASSLGTMLGLSQLVIGTTIVALGTSLPELIINVFASVEGETGLALGNVIGSNITNTLLIVGAAALIYPIKVKKIVEQRDIWINLLAVLFLILLVSDNIFGRSDNQINVTDGIIMLGLFLYYVYIAFFRSGSNVKGSGENETQSLPWYFALFFVAGGMGGLFFGGQWIVAGVQQLSRDLGTAQSVLGLTLVAGATSLPELVTSVLAALRKKTDIAIGNIIGSNILNIFLVLGVSAVIKPIDFDPALNIQLLILFLASLFLILVIRTGKISRTVSRIEGAFLILLYICFLYYSIYR